MYQNVFEITLILSLKFIPSALVLEVCVLEVSRSLKLIVLLTKILFVLEVCILEVVTEGDSRYRSSNTIVYIAMVVSAVDPAVIFAAGWHMTLL